MLTAALKPPGALMLGRLVTLETYMNAMQAHLVKNHLEGAGIRCVLADEYAVSMSWHLSNAIGGIKLQVAEEDLERAEQVLDAIERSHRNAEPVDDSAQADTDKPASEAKPAADPIDPEDAEEPPLNAREQMAERAYRAVLIGLVVFPLQFYATWLLLSVWQEDQAIRPALRRKLAWAVGLNAPFVVVAFFFSAIYMRAMIYGVE